MSDSEKPAAQAAEKKPTGSTLEADLTKYKVPFFPFFPFTLFYRRKFNLAPTAIGRLQQMS